MMAPHHERLRVLHAALDAAGAELSDPIDRIEVRGGEVLFWTASERLAVSYDYANRYDERGSLMPGSGSWVVRPGKVQRTPAIAGPFRSAWQRLVNAISRR